MCQLIISDNFCKAVAKDGLKPAKSHLKERKNGTGGKVDPPEEQARQKCVCMQNKSPSFDLACDSVG